MLALRSGKIVGRILAKCGAVVERPHFVRELMFTEK